MKKTFLSSFGLVIFSIVLSFFIIQDASADEFTFGSTAGNYLKGAVNLNKTSYTAGENIEIASSFSSIVYAGILAQRGDNDVNYPYGSTYLYISVGDAVKTLTTFKESGSVSFPSFSAVAPSVPGTYTFSVSAGFNLSGTSGFICAGGDGNCYNWSAPDTSVSLGNQYFNYTVVAAPVNGKCGSSNAQPLLAKPTTNLCSDGTLPTVSGTGPWTWTCAGSNGGKDASCSTTAVGTCTAVPEVSTPQGYYCPSGTLNGANCETTSSYNATLSGQINFDKHVCFSNDQDGNCATGAYASATPFVNSEPIGNLYDNMGITGCSKIITNGPTVYCTQGYVSTVPINGLTDTISYSTIPGNMASLDFVSSAYMADTPKLVGGSYSCNPGDTLSGATCTKTISTPATPTYACSNVCSGAYNNTKTSFTSTDPTCPTTIATTVGLVKYYVDCNCGISATKTDPAGIIFKDALNLAALSSCTLCAQAATGVCGAANNVPTATAPTAFLCSIAGGNPSAVSDGGTVWNWNCEGSTTTAPCSANKSCTPDYTHFWTTAPNDSCDASKAGQTIVTETAQCNRTDKNKCNLGGFPASTDCNAATKPADKTTICPTPLKIKSWQEVAQ